MILIIRPKSEIQDLIKILDKKKYSYFFEPFTYFRKIKTKINYNPKHYYLISSKQAVHSLKHNLDQHKKLIQDGTFLVIGEKIKKELTAIGVRNISRTFLDSYGLEDYLKKNKKIKFVNHLTSNVPNEVIRKIEHSGDAKIIYSTLYKTYFKKKLSPNLNKLFNRKKILIMFHYSLKSAEVFFKKLTNQEKIYLRSSVTHFCLSKRISIGLEKMKIESRNLKVAEKPSQKALLLLLNNM